MYVCRRVRFFRFYSIECRPCHYDRAFIISLYSRYFECTRPFRFSGVSSRSLARSIGFIIFRSGRRICFRRAIPAFQPAEQFTPDGGHQRTLIRSRSTPPWHVPSRSKHYPPAVWLGTNEIQIRFIFKTYRSKRTVILSVQIVEFETKILRYIIRASVSDIFG